MPPTLNGSVPHSLDIERALLGSMLLNNDKAHWGVESLERRLFYYPPHQKIFDAIVDVCQRQDPVDIINVAELLDAQSELDSIGGPPYLAKLAETVPHAAHAESYAEQLAEIAGRRQVLESMAECYNRTKDESRPIIETTVPLFRHLLSMHAPTGNARTEQTWPDLSTDAMHGIAGEFVRVVEPHTEADPAALLIQFLVCFGSVAGRNAFYPVEADRHYTNTFAVLVGKSSKGRKGTSMGQVLRVFRKVAIESVESWVADNIISGLSSGEGLISRVRDNDVFDKRVLVQEGEFASILHAVRREGNTLSPVIRNAWDKGELRTLTKNNPLRATDAHVSIIGHITAPELRRYLTDVESGNGFANRFLWVCVQRSKELPDGGSLTDGDLDGIAKRLASAISFAQEPIALRRDDDARELWHRVYGELSSGRPGLWGSVTSRGEAHVVRLSSLYALLDESDVIRIEHLKAALALWSYCDRSAGYVFGESLGDPIADQILDAIREAGTLNKTEIRDLFNRNHTSKIKKAILLLLDLGLIREVSVSKGGPGRPETRYVYIERSYDLTT